MWQKITGVDKYWNLHDIFEICNCLIQLLPYGFHGLLSQICFENRTPGHRINTDNPAKWSQTYLLAEVAHQDIVASRHFQLTCTNYAFSLASVVLLLRAHLPTLAHDATMVRLWMHQPKNIKHDRYLSHGRARPNARGINAHTWQVRQSHPITEVN